MSVGRARGPLPGAPERSARRVAGRYAIHREIAAGGMATVHLARLLGSVGFSRTVAVKRLHPHLARDPEFVGMFLDEARVAARVRHANVVSIVDVVAEADEILLVMEYVHGESLWALVRDSRAAGRFIPPEIVVPIVGGALHGLHAAHEAKDGSGAPLHLVHRDVSPQNVLVGVDGLARVVDFGVAKARGRAQTTREGQLKGKLGYMAPEQVRGEVTPRSDVFGAAVVLWESLTLRRLFHGENEAEVVYNVLERQLEPPSAYVDGLPPALDAVVMRGLARDPAARWPTALEMALALERTVGARSTVEVGAWVADLAAARLEERARILEELERFEEDEGSGTIAPARPAAKTPGALAVGPAAAASGSTGSRRRPRSTARVAVVAAIGSAALTAAAAWGLAAPRRPAEAGRDAARPDGTPVVPAAAAAVPVPATAPSAEPASSAAPEASVEGGAAAVSASTSAPASPAGSAPAPPATHAWRPRRPPVSAAPDRSKYYGRD